MLQIDLIQKLQKVSVSKAEKPDSITEKKNIFLLQTRETSQKIFSLARKYLKIVS